MSEIISHLSYTHADMLLYHFTVWCYNMYILLMSCSSWVLDITHFSLIFYLFIPLLYQGFSLHECFSLLFLTFYRPLHLYIVNIDESTDVQLINTILNTWQMLFRFQVWIRVQQPFQKFMVRYLLNGHPEILRDDDCFYVLFFSCRTNLSMPSCYEMLNEDR